MKTVSLTFTYSWCRSCIYHSLCVFQSLEMGNYPENVSIHCVTLLKISTVFHLLRVLISECYLLAINFV